jgi:hypothetical protein
MTVLQACGGGQGSRSNGRKPVIRVEAASAQRGYILCTMRGTQMLLSCDGGYLKEQMRGLNDLLRQKLSSLYILLLHW